MSAKLDTVHNARKRKRFPNANLSVGFSPDVVFRHIKKAQHVMLCFFNVVGLSRLELPTSRLSGACSNQLSYNPEYGGDKRIRTADPLLAKQVLYQLSYTPESLAVSVYRQLIKNSIAEKICQRIFYYLTIFLRRRRFLENHIPIYAFTTLLRASAFLEYCLFETSRFLRPIQYALMS